MSDEEEEKEEAAAEEDIQQYRLVVARHAPLPAPKDLQPTLDWLIKTLQEEDSALFSLNGESPAGATIPILEGDESKVEAFLAVSEIQWSFGRDPWDPTHRVCFFNDHQDDRSVFVRISFVTEGVEWTGPGLLAELILGVDAAGPRDKLRGAQLDKLFSYLVSAIHPDFGHVELPGHPDPIRRPTEYQVGWITYLAHGELTVPLLDPPAVVIREDAGMKILATPAIALEKYADVAKEIEAVREALKPKDPGEPGPGQPPPPPVPVVVQAASYMGGRPAGQFAIEEESTQAGERAGLPLTPLPFAAPPAAKDPARSDTMPGQQPGAPPPATPFQPPPATPFQPPPAAPFPPPSAPFQPPPAAPKFGLPPPAPPPPPAEGPRRATTLVIPPGGDPNKDPNDPRKRLGGLPFVPKPADDDKDPKKGGS